MLVTREQIKAALELTDFDVQVAHQKMAPLSRALTRPTQLAGSPRLGGVLLLLFRKNGSMQVLLTRRRDDLAAHAGQISFPGGRNEAPESLLATALREAQEEVGLAPDKLEILGDLQPIYIPPTDYEVHSFVGWYGDQAQPQFQAEPGEVAEIIEAPLATLLDPASRREEPRQFGDMQLSIPYFAVQGHKVWGATAIMLSEFIERLRTILD